MPKQGCVGAFRRPCLFLTDRILCDSCQAVVDEAQARYGTKFDAWAQRAPRLTSKGWEAATS